MIETRFPDVEKLTILLLQTEIAALATVGGLWRVANFWPSDLSQRVPFTSVTKVDGRSSTAATVAMVDVDVFAGGRDQAESVAMQIEQLLLSGWHRNVHGQVDLAIAPDSPKALPWEDSAITRYHASYWLSARR